MQLIECEAITLKVYRVLWLSISNGRT